MKNVKLTITEVKRLNKKRHVSCTYDTNKEGNRYVKTRNILKVERQLGMNDVDFYGFLTTD